MRMDSCEFFMFCPIYVCLILTDISHRYFHKVPEQPPELPVKATFGLASAEPYTLPPVNPAWTEDALKTLKSTRVDGDKPQVEQI
jgi:hypothetical protein